MASVTTSAGGLPFATCMIDVSCGPLHLRERTHLQKRKMNELDSRALYYRYAPRRRIEIEALQKALREEKYREVSLVKTREVVKTWARAGVQHTSMRRIHASSLLHEAGSLARPR